MTTCLGKSCSFGNQCVFFVGVNQILCVLLSLLVLRVACWICLYYFVIIAFLFAFNSTFRYLEDLVNTDNNVFDSKVNHIYPSLSVK